MNLKTILGYFALAFIVWYVIGQPAAASHVVASIGAALTGAAHGLSGFFAGI